MDLGVKGAESLRHEPRRRGGDSRPGRGPLSRAQPRARLLHRVVVGNVVVDHEEVARSFPEGPGKLELMALYEVRAGKIAEARFVFGRKTLDA